MADNADAVDTVSRPVSVKRSTPVSRLARDRGRGRRVGPAKPSPSPSTTPVDTDTVTDVDVDDDAGAVTAGSDAPRAVRKRAPNTLARLAVLLVPVLLVVGVAAAGWFAYDRHDSAASAASVNSQREAFLQAGRQAALNLSTIRFAQLDGDVKRILDSTGDPFRADFASRAESFKSVVREAKSSSVGELAGAGISSFDGKTAVVAVAANVKTSNVGQPDQDPRSWRMKVTVKKVNGKILATSVEFVA